MARLPDETAIGRAPVRSVDSVVIGQADPIGGAAATFAAGVNRAAGGLDAIARVGTSIASEDADREKFDTEANLIKFQKERRQALTDEAAKLDGDPTGFADRQRQAFREQGESIYNSAPERLKPIVRNRLLSADGDYYSSAQAIERKQSDTFHGKRLSDATDDLKTEIAKDPSKYAELKERGLGLIKAAPVSQELKRRWEEQWRSGSALTAFDADVQRDPEAARTGLGFGAGKSIVERIVGVESGGNATAKNPNSSATGAGQFIEGTWMQFIKERYPEMAADRGEALSLRNDPKLAREAVAWYAQKNARDLRESGFSDTPGNLYLAHFAGPKGAKALLRADADASAGSVLGEDVVAANPFLRGKTAGWVRDWANKKMAGITGEVTAPYGEELTPEQRQQLGARAERVRLGQVAEQQAQTQQTLRALQRDINDDLASIQRTGQGLDEARLSRGRIAATQGEEAARTWEQDRSRALRVHDATKDIDNLPNDELDARVARLEPKPGAEGFEKDVEAQRTVERRVERIRKAREQDPAMSVEGLPEVRKAREAWRQSQREGGDESRALSSQLAQAVIQARLNAQQEVGITNPLAVTRAESRVIARQLRAIGDDNPEALETLMGQLRQTYGKHAEAVLNSTLQLQGVSKDLSNAAGEVLATIGMGKAPTKDQKARLKDAAQTAEGDALMTGKPPIKPDTPLTPAITTPIPGTMDGFAAPDPSQAEPTRPAPIRPQRDVGATIDPTDIRSLVNGQMTEFDFNLKYNAGDGLSAATKLLDAYAARTGRDPRRDEGWRARQEQGVRPPSAPMPEPKPDTSNLPDLTPKPEPDPGPEREPGKQSSLRMERGKDGKLSRLVDERSGKALVIERDELGRMARLIEAVAEAVT